MEDSKSVSNRHYWFLVKTTIIKIVAVYPSLETTKNANFQDAITDINHKTKSASWSWKTCQDSDQA